jgi:hypothetical protein
MEVRQGGRYLHIRKEEGDQTFVILRLEGLSKYFDSELVLKKNFLLLHVEADDAETDIVEDIGIDAFSKTGGLADRTFPVRSPVRTGNSQTI